MKLKLIAFSLSLTVATILLPSCGGDPSFSLTSESTGFKQINNQTSAIDVLWIIDNSGSMTPAQNKLTTNFNSFITSFSAKSIDYKIAVASTDAYNGAVDVCSPFYRSYLARFRDGADVPASFTSALTDPGQACDEVTNPPIQGYDAAASGYSYSGVRVITPSTPDIIDTFLTNATLGTAGSGLEQGMASFQAAIESPFNTGYLREDAYLAVIIVSDENDSSPETSSFYKAYLDTITGSTASLQKYSVSTVTKQSGDICAEANHSASRVGTKYEELADLTNGDKISLCSDFAVALDDLAENIIIKALVSVFEIFREPIVSTLTVNVNGASVPMSDGVSDGWEYSNPVGGDYAGKHIISFIGDSTPPAGASISIDYDPASFDD